MSAADHVADPASRSTPDTEAVLGRVVELVANARPMPLSASVMVNRDEVLDLLRGALDRLPEELRAARWLLKEREEYLARMHREGDEILEEARAQAGRMVQRAEVVRAAEQTARRTVEAAEADARRLRLQAEDYCDQKLAQFEIVLDRTIKTVQAGRARLQVTAPSQDDEVQEARQREAADAFFDQDDAG